MTMESRLPGGPVEAPPGLSESGARAGRSTNATPAHLDDARALTILTTEHWGLLTARSLVYNEAFSRAGMFLAFLSTTLIALGLLSTAMGFTDDGFLITTAIVLALDLFIGLASLGRIAAASSEDLRYLQGMNRLRHAYLEMVPGLERYFITSQFDDFDSVAQFYGPTSTGVLRGLLHGFTTTPGMIGVICSAVAGGLVAVIAILLTHDDLIGSLAGLVGFFAFFVALNAVVVWQVGGVMRTMAPMFPPPPPPGVPPRP